MEKYKLKGERDMRNPKLMVSKILKHKLHKERTNRGSIVLSFIIVIAMILFSIFLAIKVQGNEHSTKKNLAALLKKNLAKSDNSLYIEPTSSVKGSYIYGGRVWDYASDPGTSKIEGLFEGIPSDDGKVLVDKSVVYKKDDYSAFNKYDDGVFGVAMSALAQQYNIYHGKTEDVPMDVVFILDTSGSMKNNYIGEITRVESMVNAVNLAIQEIMDLNPNNRIAIVDFSDGSGIFLKLDRYSTKNVNKKYLDYLKGEIQTVADGITNSLGKNVKATTANQTTVDNWLGTYTQSGIARANDIFKVNTDITYTSKDGFSVKRKPVVMFLSDGEPTYCTSNYGNVLSGPHYGSGSPNSYINNQGVLGYYTILSANYYKKQIENHYGRNSGFYTIGMGINQTGTENSTSASITGDDYKRAVLNPSKANIAGLYNNAKAENTNTGLQMCKLLDNTYPDKFISVLSEYVDSLGGYTNKQVPVIKNPYKGTSYKYNDNAYFGTMPDEELKKIFSNIIKESIERVEYSFSLEQNTTVKITDPVGYGMEIINNPILRYNGKNYTATSQWEMTVNEALIKTYNYSYKAKDDNTGRVVELDKIIVKLTIDKNGNYKMDMDIPDICMPVYTYSRELESYYDELPIRLIYQVAMKNDKTSKPIEGEVYYTNSWKEDTAYATLSPTENNPYYKEGGVYSNNSTNKKQNTTGTRDISSSYIRNGKQIKILLGNNGKIIVGRETSKFASITIKKKWQSYFLIPIQNTSAFPEVKVELWRRIIYTGVNGGNTSVPLEEIYETITLRHSENFQKVWDKLCISEEKIGGTYQYKYYVKEISSIPGYITSYSSENSTGIQSGELQIINTAKTGMEILPKTGGTGTKFYLICGILAIFLSTISYIYIKKLNIKVR